ncbi:MAG: GNAT family N-acetyltransferase [Kordiimonadales bacterium]|nr:MAG: GNAT family N-acetyltransferase [Kordiimonadales bacterium]
MTAHYEIRDIAAGDLPAVLRLNTEYEHFLSPLSLDELMALRAQAQYARLVELNSTVVAFLIAFTPRSGYGSVNYQWFDAHYDDYCYIDRIAIAEEAQGCGLGTALYDDLTAFSVASGLKKLACEYYCEPLNAGSAKFHSKYGFVEVGQQDVQGGSKRVSLQVRAL